MGSGLFIVQNSVLGGGLDSGADRTLIYLMFLTWMVFVMGLISAKEIFNYIRLTFRDILFAAAIAAGICAIVYFLLEAMAKY
jgi:hypothetical protein